MCQLPVEGIGGDGEQQFFAAIWILCSELHALAAEMHMWHQAIKFGVFRNRCD